MFQVAVGGACGGGERKGGAEEKINQSRRKRDWTEAVAQLPTERDVQSKPTLTCGGSRSRRRSSAPAPVCVHVCFHAELRSVIPSTPDKNAAVLHHRNLNILSRGRRRGHIRAQIVFQKAGAPPPPPLAIFFFPSLLSGKQQLYVQKLVDAESEKPGASRIIISHI